VLQIEGGETGILDEAAFIPSRQRNPGEPVKNQIKHSLVKRLQKIGWVYFIDVFVAVSIDDIHPVELQVECRLLPITIDNYSRVGEFREENRISEYRDKLARKEIGYFAEHQGKIIGSIWATINHKETANVVRNYMKLAPGEGLIHDIVVYDQFRGKGIGPFMVSRIAPILFKEHALRKVIVDVKADIPASLSMMNKVGLRVDHRSLCISALGHLVYQKVFKSHA
jgi:GNAT superfamily N-acetyltransferase